MPRQDTSNVAKDIGHSYLLSEPNNAVAEPQFAVESHSRRSTSMRLGREMFVLSAQLTVFDVTEDTI